MNFAPVILVLAGARETVQSVQALRGHRCCVLWADDSTPVSVEADVVEEVPDKVSAVLDVTHAFDTKTRTRCVAPEIPYARVARALWEPGPDDQWTCVDTLEHAISALPNGARVFAATGLDSAPALAKHDGPVFLRQLVRHGRDAPVNCSFVFGAGPFDEKGEVVLMRDLGIDVVLARNVGGPDSYPKLAAARTLGMPVVLLQPPPLPAGPLLRAPEEIAAWAQSL